MYIVDLRILVLVKILKMCDGEEHDNKMAKRSGITHNIVRDREGKGFASELQLKKCIVGIIREHGISKWILILEQQRQILKRKAS